MNNLVVKKALYTKHPIGRNEYFVIGKKGGRNCVFRIWRDDRSGHTNHFPLAYNVSPYEAECVLQEDIHRLDNAPEAIPYDLTIHTTQCKANQLLKWLESLGELDKPIDDCPIRTSHIDYVYKTRQKLDPRMVIAFSGEDYLCLAEFKISKAAGWKNGAIVSPIAMWGKEVWQKNPSKIDLGVQSKELSELIAQYVSFAVSINDYNIYGVIDPTQVGLTNEAIGKLFRQNEFLWTPEEEQPEIPDTFIPNVQYRAERCYTIANLWDKHRPRRRNGVFAWNDNGEIELVIPPN